MVRKSPTREEGLLTLELQVGISNMKNQLQSIFFDVCGLKGFKWIFQNIFFIFCSSPPETDVIKLRHIYIGNILSLLTPKSVNALKG